jgi:hypothetical protein
MSEPQPQTGTGRQPSTGPLASQYVKGAIPEAGKTTQQVTDLDPYDWFESLAFTNGSNWCVIVGAYTGRTQTDNTDVIVVKAPNGDKIDGFTVGFTTSGQAEEGMIRRMLLPPGGSVTALASTILSVVRCYSLKWAVLAL